MYRAFHDGFGERCGVVKIRQEQACHFFSRVWVAHFSISHRLLHRVGIHLFKYGSQFIQALHVAVEEGCRCICRFFVADTAQGLPVFMPEAEKLRKCLLLSV